MRLTPKGPKGKVKTAKPKGEANTAPSGVIKQYMGPEHRAQMKDDIKQFTGESAEMSYQRPARKILRHHQ